MARNIGALCRLCRREGVKLFLKGNRCVSPKCSFEKRSYNPGQHGKARTKLSDYGLQLREKQKVKRIYGVFEKQFRSYFKKAEQQKGITGEVLLQMLERRLDNAVFRACFASSRAQARQMVRHGAFTVNGRKINIPSYMIKRDDLLALAVKKEVYHKTLSESFKANMDRGVPDWIKVDENQLTAKIVELPKREDVRFPVDEQLIVELYSK